MAEAEPDVEKRLAGLTRRTGRGRGLAMLDSLAESPTEGGGGAGLTLSELQQLYPESFPSLLENRGTDAGPPVTTEDGSAVAAAIEVGGPIDSVELDSNEPPEDEPHVLNETDVPFARPRGREAEHLEVDAMVDDLLRSIPQQVGKIQTTADQASEGPSEERAPESAAKVFTHRTELQAAAAAGTEIPDGLKYAREPDFTRPEGFFPPPPEGEPRDKLSQPSLLSIPEMLRKLPVDEEEGAAIYAFKQEPIRITEMLLNSMLMFATDNKANDVFLQTGYPAYAQVHGRLKKLTRRNLDQAELEELLDRFSLSYLPRMKDRDEVIFRHDFKLSEAMRYSYRVAAAACHAVDGSSSGVEVVMRSIPWDTPTIEQLEIEDLIMEYSYPDEGLVLVTGPTGSGKSTLLAALLRHCLTWGKPGEGKRLLTFENPIEFNLRGIPNQTGMVTQREVPSHLKSYVLSLAHALRCKPDAILVGEMREIETIEGGILAADTGHTVYSTVHTKGCINAPVRMAGVFPSDAREAVFMKVIDSARLVIHQRLLRKPDGSGKVALREILPFPEDLREEIINHPDRYNDLAKQALHDIGKPLLVDAKEKMERGLITKADYEKLAKFRTKDLTTVL